MTFLNVLAVIFALGAISILWRRIKYHGLIVGTVYGLFALIPWVIGIFIIAALGGGINMAADNFAQKPEQKQEAWRQEQIAATGEDPCARTYEMERERRHHQELIDSGQISNQQAVIDIMNNDPYAGMSWEERQAALDHDHEMSSKCPPLDYVESLDQPGNDHQ